MIKFIFIAIVFFGLLELWFTICDIMRKKEDKKNERSDRSDIE